MPRDDDDPIIPPAMPGATSSTKSSPSPRDKERTDRIKYIREQLPHAALDFKKQELLKRKKLLSKKYEYKLVDAPEEEEDPHAPQLSVSDDEIKFAETGAYARENSRYYIRYDKDTGSISVHDKPGKIKSKILDCYGEDSYVGKANEAALWAKSQGFTTLVVKFNPITSCTEEKIKKYLEIAKTYNMKIEFPGVSLTQHPWNHHKNKEWEKFMAIVELTRDQRAQDQKAHYETPEFKAIQSNQKFKDHLAELQKVNNKPVTDELSSITNTDAKIQKLEALIQDVASRADKLDGYGKDAIDSLVDWTELRATNPQRAKKITDVHLPVNETLVNGIKTEANGLEARLKDIRTQLERLGSSITGEIEAARNPAAPPDPDKDNKIKNLQAQSSKVSNAITKVDEANNKLKNKSTTLDNLGRLSDDEKRDHLVLTLERELASLKKPAPVSANPPPSPRPGR